MYGQVSVIPVGCSMSKPVCSRYACCRRKHIVDLVCILQFAELPEYAGNAQESRRFTTLYDSSLLHDQYFVHPSKHIHAIRNDKCRATACRSIERRMNVVLRFGIDRCRGVIQYKNRWIH